MTEIDKVLEAENVIQNIAVELKKMKSAADLMDSAQVRINEVIDTSSNIITNIGEFVKEGTQIVKRIGDYDIQTDLKTIINDVKKVKSDTSEVFDSFGTINTSLNNIHSEIKKYIGDQFEEIKDSINYLRVKIENRVKILVSLFGFNILLTIIILLLAFRTG